MLKKGGAVFLLVGILLALCSDGLGESEHVNWEFGMQCKMVKMQLKHQIHEWRHIHTDSGKCMYRLVSFNSNTLFVTCDVIGRRSKADLSFQFTPQGSGTCAVIGVSSSDAVLSTRDKFNYYLSLRKLITGSNLDKTPGFKEWTSDV